MQQRSDGKIRFFGLSHGRSRIQLFKKLDETFESLMEGTSLVKQRPFNCTFLLCVRPQWKIFCVSVCWEWASVGDSYFFFWLSFLNDSSNHSCSPVSCCDSSLTNHWLIVCNFFPYKNENKFLGLKTTVTCRNKSTKRTKRIS